MININFQESIIIVYNLNKFKTKFDIFDYLSVLDFDELFNQIYDINHKNDIIIIFGAFIDYYIGFFNEISLIWNYINSNLIFYINNNNYLYFNINNIFIIEECYNPRNFNNKVINYNSNLFIVHNNNLLNIEKKYNFYIDYYFNDFIFRFSLKQKIVLKEILIVLSIIN